MLPKWAMSAPALGALTGSPPTRVLPSESAAHRLFVTTRVRPSRATRAMNSATAARRALGFQGRTLAIGWRPLNQTVAEEGAIPDLNDARFPLHADFGAILQPRYELAQDIQVRSPVEQEEPLIIEHPRPASLGD